ncbi:hypothetical protein QE197_20950 (plasmid) [Arsenophonus nasoniae]|uniref:hypothetical protein n=1 Tax=Arsenophonus nasoniae TaxID=638 RepID=UPI0004090622|nr:hypothetical protein [Arsenophonus nasoniae]WGM12866.1 hypothetical protein QE197_20950 [Arsenophonus nasoniae]WGM17573.1 hypothetical protein QE193_19580 [Arsenophonus nasoniae]
MEEKLSTGVKPIKKDYIFFDYKRLAGFFGGFVILFFLLFSINYKFSYFFIFL